MRHLKLTKDLIRNGYKLISFNNKGIVKLTKKKVTIKIKI